MRQSFKETMMLHMQAEFTFNPREAGTLFVEGFRPGGIGGFQPEAEAARPPWHKPGR
jgi:hypothetical protein